MKIAQAIDQYLKGGEASTCAEMSNRQRLVECVCYILDIEEIGWRGGVESAITCQVAEAGFEAVAVKAHDFCAIANVVRGHSSLWLSSLHVPCIACFRDRYIVITRLTDNYVHTFCPREGRRKLSRESFELLSKDEFLCLKPSSARREGDNKKKIGIRDLYRNIQGLKSAILTIFAVSIVVQAFAIVLPLFAQLTIDNIIPNNDRTLLLLLCFGFGLVVTLDAIAKVVRVLYATNMLAYLNANTLANAFDHLLHLPLDFFEKHKLGDIQSRFKSIEPLNGQVATSFVEIVMDALMVTSMMIIMIFYAPSIAIISFGFALSVATTRYLYNGRIKSLHRAACEQYAESSNYFIETFSSMQSIRAMQSGKGRLDGWLNKHLGALSSDENRIKLSVSADIISEYLINIEMLIVIALIAFRVIDSQMTLGSMFAYLSYRAMFSNHSAELLKNVFELRALSVYLNRISTILCEPRLEYSTSPNFELSPSKVPVPLTLNSVTYTPPGARRPMFKDLSLHVGAGELLVLKGASGVGKSTLLKIMMGLVSASKGEVYHGNRYMQPDSVHQHADFSAVLQGDRVFSGTIYENVMAGGSNYDWERMVECCQYANIHDEIKGFEHAYETVLNRNEMKLSGGQELRVLLARALYANPRIIFLDEITSNLDSRNETLVNNRIRQLQVTRVVVAHKGDLDKYADRVIDVGAISQVNINFT